jgi:ABC-2 type transport system permease protein
MTSFQKYVSTIRIELSSQLAYKLNFILLILGPAAVFFFIKVNLWWSIFTVRENEPVAGYSFERMLEYQVYVLVATLLSQAYVSRNISEDIRFGRISAFLLYPTSFMGYHFGAFSAAQILNVATVALVLSLVWISGIIPIASVAAFVSGLALTFVVSLLWFSIWFLLSCTAFWLDEAWVIRVMFAIVARFLSGAVIPLDIFPEGLRTLLWYTPFPYLTFVPVQTMMGTPPVDFVEALTITLAWLAIASSCAYLIWRRGLRLYSAAGI